MKVNATPRRMEVKKPDLCGHPILEIWWHTDTRTPFTRSYDELFSGEVFTVRTRKITDRVPVYSLTDYGGEKVEGNFYASELTPVRFDPNSFFKIEKVLKTRVRNGVEEKLVKYQSWPSKYNEWVISGRIRDLRNKKKKNTKKKRKK